MKTCCDNPACRRPFGLIRWNHHFRQFCSARCRDSYERDLQRNSSGWKWLFNYSDSLRDSGPH